MYGTIILTTLASIVMIGIISPALGMAMIATTVFATLIFFRIQSFSHIPRPVYTPKEVGFSRRNPYTDMVGISVTSNVGISRRNPYALY